MFKDNFFLFQIQIDDFNSSSLSPSNRWSEMTAAPTMWLWVTMWPAARLSTFPLWSLNPWMFTVLTSCCLTSGSTPHWLRQSWFPWQPGFLLRVFTCSWKQVTEAKQRISKKTTVDCDLSVWELDHEKIKTCTVRGREYGWREKNDKCWEGETGERRAETKLENSDYISVLFYSSVIP